MKMDREHKQIILFLITIFAAIAMIALYLNTLGVIRPQEVGDFQKAPELQGIAAYLNTDNVKLSDLKGKVVLVDFWTYTCINCIRTLPYLKEWYSKYSDEGFVIIGVHTPEFEFEKDYDNVKMAVEKYGIKYPVVLDNDYKTWNAYKNQFWPRKYLIDSNGLIRYDHIGEGGYEETERKIQELLAETGSRVNQEISKPQNTIDVNPTQVNTPEIYLGYSFARTPLGNAEGFQPGQSVNYSLPSKASPNTVYLNGVWKNNADDMELISDEGDVVLVYSAKAVNIVAGRNSSLEVYVDGKVVDESNNGSDAAGGKVNVDEQRLYNLVFDKDYGVHSIQIKIRGKGFQIYTFTFG